jgi:hypothetical protein
MIRRAIGIFLLLLFLISCDYLSPATTAENSELQVLDTVIDYTKVDVYPIFSDCENFAENDNQKKCFEVSLIEKLTELLHKNELKVKERVNDTALIDLLIDQTGKASVVNINSPEIITNQLPTLDSIIRQSVSALPTMKPAIKKGIFVRSQYRLAIVVKTI